MFYVLFDLDSIVSNDAMMCQDRLKTQKISKYILHQITKNSLIWIFTQNYLDSNIFTHNFVKRDFLWVIFKDCEATMKQKNTSLISDLTSIVFLFLKDK